MFHTAERKKFTFVLFLLSFLLDLKERGRRKAHHSHISSFRYLNFCCRTRVNFDIPVHRFIVMSGYYLVYLALVLLVMLRPLSVNLTEHSEGFAWYHVCLSAFTFSMLWEDFVNISVMR